MINTLNSNTRTSERRNTAFTLIELLVVIAIIAILAAILFPVFAQAREKARQTTCLSNVKQIMLGVKMYCQDYDEQSPYWLWSYSGYDHVWLTWMEVVNPYIKNKSVWICPDASLDAQSYISDAPANVKVTATYAWPAWLPYNEWSWYNNQIQFAGFPVPCGHLPTDPYLCGPKLGVKYPPINSDLCGPGTSGPALCVSTEFVAAPAQSGFLVEGYMLSTVPTAGTEFGNAYTTGVDYLQNNKHSRHSNGENIGFCDGHAKWMVSDKFWLDGTAGTHTGIPENAYMQVGE